jgi:hypothetical protein
MADRNLFRALSPMPNDETFRPHIRVLHDRRVPQPILRRPRNHPDHHLFRRRNRIWWIRFTARPAPNAARAAFSLATEDVIEARRRRDALLNREHDFKIRIDSIGPFVNP